MQAGYYRDGRGRVWLAFRDQHAAGIAPAEGPRLPGGRGLSGLGEVPSVYFTWRAPTKISFGSFLTDGWNAAQARLGNKLAERGVRITKITSEAISYFPQLRYALIVNGHAPQGIDGFKDIIADLADAEGFRVDRSGIEFRSGGTPRPGDGGGGGDDEEESGWSAYLLPAVLAILVVGFIRR